MDANERYEKIKELMVRREEVVAEIDGELAALFTGARAGPTALQRACSSCGQPGHNAKTCPTKEKGTALSAAPVDQ